MAIVERLSYALIGAIFGAFVGVVCWWLYGLGSLGYSGPAIDPILSHWLTYTSSAFGLIGFLFRERVGDAIGCIINAIFHFNTISPLEANEEHGEQKSMIVGLVLLVIIVAAIWFTVPAPV